MRAQTSAEGVPEMGPQYERRVMRAIRRIIRSVDLYSHKLALECGVTVPQLLCLNRLVDAGPMSLKDLAAAADLSASTTVGIVDRLEKKELVLRQRSQSDRRRLEILLTDKGRIIAKGSPSPLQDRLANALNALPELERVAIVLSLERIVGLMGIETVVASPILDTGVDLQAEASIASAGNLGSLDAEMPVEKPVR